MQLSNGLLVSALFNKKMHQTVYNTKGKLSDSAIYPLIISNCMNRQRFPTFNLDHGP